MRVKVFQIGRWAVPFLCEEVVEPGLPCLGKLDVTRDELDLWLTVIEAEAEALVRSSEARE